MVYFPEYEQWYEGLQDEMLRFPDGKNDDQVDALAWIGKMMEMFVPIPPPREEKKKSWRDKLSALGVTTSGGGAMSA